MNWIFSCLSLHANGQLVAPTGHTLDLVHGNDSTLRRYLESLVSGTAVRRTMEFILLIDVDEDRRASLVHSSSTLTSTFLVFVFVSIYPSALHVYCTFMVFV